MAQMPHRNPASLRVIGKSPNVPVSRAFERPTKAYGPWKASPRVKVFSIGKTEEGREMIAVAVSSEANLSKLEANRANLAKLAGR